MHTKFRRERFCLSLFERHQYEHSANYRVCELLILNKLLMACISVLGLGPLGSLWSGSEPIWPAGGRARLPPRTFQRRRAVEP